ncbi:MAG: hypothetical protein HYV97_03805 [Bdellovibrio sp.]|nr:hypothetical protein [Bdellovibrio sp.]
MKYLLILIVISCTSLSHKISEQDITEIRTDMAAANKRLRGYLSRKVMNNDLTNISMTIYLQELNKNLDPSEKEYMDFIKKYSPDWAILGRKAHFSICFHAKAAKLAMCDKTETNEIDFVDTEGTTNIQEKIHELTNSI